MPASPARAARGPTPVLDEANPPNPRDASPSLAPRNNVQLHEGFVALTAHLQTLSTEVRSIKDCQAQLAEQMSLLPTTISNMLSNVPSSRDIHDLRRELSTTICDVGDTVVTRLNESLLFIREHIDETCRRVPSPPAARPAPLQSFVPTASVPGPSSLASASAAYTYHASAGGEGPATATLPNRSCQVGLS